MRGIRERIKRGLVFKASQMREREAVRMLTHISKTRQEKEVNSRQETTPIEKYMRVLSTHAQPRLFRCLWNFHAEVFFQRLGFTLLDIVSYFTHFHSLERS